MKDLNIQSFGALSVSIYSLTLLLVGMILAWWLKNDAMLNLLTGVIATNATTIVSFWVGSSSGSQKKDDTLAAQLPPPQPATVAKLP